MQTDTQTEQENKPKKRNSNWRGPKKYGPGTYVHDAASAARAIAKKEKILTGDFVKLMVKASNYQYAEHEFRDMLDIFFRTIPACTNAGKTIALTGVCNINPYYRKGQAFCNPLAGSYVTEDSLTWTVKLGDRYKAWMKTVDPLDINTALREVDIYEIPYVGIKGG